MHSNSNSIYKKRLKRQNKTKKQNKTNNKINTIKVPKNFLPIKPPAILSFEENGEQTSRFFYTLRSLIDTNREIFVDFKTLKKISPEASLVLVAEIDRLKMYRNIKLKVFDVDKWSKSIFLQFRDMGMFKLLKVNNISRRYRGMYNSDPRKFISFEKGESINMQKAEVLLKNINKLISKNLPGEKHLQIGFSEAMTNTSYWAYRFEFIKNTVFKGKYWWISAYVDAETKMLKVMIYDQGETIPGTLGLSFFKKIKLFLLNPFYGDSDIIDFAIQKGLSQTRKKNRGKGLSDIKKYAENIPKGKLLILSRFGFYSYSKLNKNKSGVEKSSLLFPTNGTLISWSGCFEKNTNIDKELYK